MAMGELRGHPRTEVELPCMLTRTKGNPVRATTKDLGAGGMRVTTERPLWVDEVVEFDLDPEAPDHPRGRARVLRQQSLNVYALRFDLAVDDILDWVTTQAAD
jgi:hypothetical protein